GLARRQAQRPDTAWPAPGIGPGLAPEAGVAQRRHLVEERGDLADIAAGAAPVPLGRQRAGRGRVPHRDAPKPDRPQRRPLLSQTTPRPGPRGAGERPESRRAEAAVAGGDARRVGAAVAGAFGLAGKSADRLSGTAGVRPGSGGGASSPPRAEEPRGRWSWLAGRPGVFGPGSFRRHAMLAVRCGRITPPIPLAPLSLAPH